MTATEIRDMCLKGMLFELHERRMPAVSHVRACQHNPNTNAQNGDMQYNDISCKHKSEPLSNYLPSFNALCKIYFIFLLKDT
jgi:hypothetical protein